MVQWLRLSTFMARARIQSLVGELRSLKLHHNSKKKKNDNNKTKNGFLKIILFIIFLAVLGFRCYAGFSLVATSRGYSLVAEWFKEGLPSERVWGAWYTWCWCVHPASPSSLRERRTSLRKCQPKAAQEAALLLMALQGDLCHMPRSSFPSTR